MKDIDFDELDKAVSGVLGTNKSVEPVKQDVVSTSDGAVLVASRQTIATESTTSESSAPLIAPAQAASPAVRRGRFMDVVHPSSDMTTGGASAQPSAPAAITAPSTRKLAPISSDIVPEAVPTPEEVVVESTDDEPKLDTIDTLTAIDAEKKEDVPPPAPLVEAVPPIEVAPAPSADNDETTPEEPAEQEPIATTEVEEPVRPQTEDEFADLTVDKVTEPSETTPTPFLTDTKVDKRPLGAFGVEDAEVATEPLPQELNTEVLKVESKEATDSDTRSSQDVLSSPENSADDSQLKHVFDSESYNAPLVTHKRSSGVWLWVILILVLLAVGSGLGYLWFVNGY